MARSMTGAPIASTEATTPTSTAPKTIAAASLAAQCAAGASHVAAESIAAASTPAAAPTSIADRRTLPADRVEAVVRAKKYGLDLSDQAAEWLHKLDDSVHEALTRTGLVASRKPAIEARPRYPLRGPNTRTGVKSNL